jgi:hypothetical protein
MERSLKTPIIGLLLGLAAGLCYGLVSEHINLVLYPEFPIYYQPGNTFIKILESGFIGGVLGFISGSFSSSYLGILAASSIGAASVIVTGIVNGTEKDILANVLLMVYGLLPLITLFIPISALLRWAANLIHDKSLGTIWQWHRGKGMVILLCASIIVGSFSAYPREAKVALGNMQQFISQAQIGEETPYLFSTVSPILEKASRDYMLAWSDDISTFPLGDGRESLAAMPITYNVVTAYFKSGEVIACLFRPGGALQLCAELR